MTYDKATMAELMNDEAIEDFNNNMKPMPLNDLPPIAPQTESIKLTKNSKGYNWEIRVLNLDIEKLAEINLKMIEKFEALE